MEQRYKTSYKESMRLVGLGLPISTSDITEQWGPSWSYTRLLEYASSRCISLKVEMSLGMQVKITATPEKSPSRQYNLMEFKPLSDCVLDLIEFILDVDSIHTQDN